MTLDNFLPHLLPELPGAPDPLVKQALLRSAIDFCQRSQAWHEMADPITLTEGVAEYDLDPPLDSRVYLLLQAWVGPQPLTPLTLQRRQLELPADVSQGLPVPTHFISSADRQSLTLYPTPTNIVAATVLRVKVCYTPKPAATTLPDLLSERYLMAVCAGTKSALMAIPGQAWSNPALSGYYRSQFDEGVVAAKIEAFYDGAPNGKLTVAPRPFGF